MRRSIFHWGSLLLVAVLCSGRLLAQVTPDARQALDIISPAIRDQKGGVATREIMGYALKAASLKLDQENVTAALELMPGLQDRDPGSPTYGNFVWLLGRRGEKPNDLNAVEFTMENAVLLWTLYRDNLSPKARDTLKDLIEVAAHGVQSQKVGPDYTNIFLLKTWNLIGIGEAFGREDLADEGYRMLDQWIDFTRVSGMPEYLSSTYLGVSIDPLALIRKYAHRQTGRDRAQAGLEFIYTYARANWFAPAERLSGAHSRTYDYLTGHGYFDKQAVDWGWLPAAQLSAADYYANAELTKWLPTYPSATGPAAAVPRFVWVRFGDAPMHHATQYITGHSSIGVASLCKGPEDQSFAINFADPKMAMVGYVMDGRNDPYGIKKVNLALGTVKAHHLAPFVTSDQVGANVLFFSTFGPFVKLYDGEPPSTCLNSHLLLPIEASVSQDGGAIQAALDGSTPLDGSKPIFIRHEDVAVGIRVIDATSDARQPVSPALFRDHDKPRAQRITWVHAAAAPKGEAHLLFLATVAEKLDDEGFARFRRQFSGLKTSFHWQDNKIAATAETLEGSRLALEADADTGLRQQSRPEPRGILEVNGVEIGEPVLASTLTNHVPE